MLRNFYVLFRPTSMKMSSMREVFFAGICLLALLLAAGCTQQAEGTAGTDAYTKAITITPTGAAPALSPSPTTLISTESWKRARIETTMGTITVALDPAMPVTTGNFETLVQNGFYNGVIFHRVIEGFMIQGGDPTGTGRGGPGYVIPDEFGVRNRNDRGTLAMANAGANTGGSQFFINLVNNNYLDLKHPVFGRVVEGMDVVDAIAKVRTTGQSGGNRPLQNVTIVRAVMV